MGHAWLERRHCHAASDKCRGEPFADGPVNAQLAFVYEQSNLPERHSRDVQLAFATRPFDPKNFPSQYSGKFFGNDHAF